MRGLCLFGLLVGCAPPAMGGPAPTGTIAADTSSGEAGGAPSSSANASTTTATTETGFTSATSSATTAAMTGTDTGSTFLIEPETGDPAVECNIYAQDCPPGQKCAWGASPEAQWWDITRCVPLVRDPLPDGAPCTYHLDPLFDGVDECGLGAMCVEAYFDGSIWDGQATCMALCKGSFEHPYCDGGAVCVGTRSMWQCVPTCDPFAQDCPVGQRCDLYGPATLCTWDYPDEPRVEVGASCDYPEQCELGATCIAAATPDCGEASCCTPFCDLSDPQATCPLPGQTCLAPYDWVNPGQEWLGVCLTEGP